jgi:hypothetical protein
MIIFQETGEPKITELDRHRQAEFTRHACLTVKAGLSISSQRPGIGLYSGRRAAIIRRYSG